MGTYAARSDLAADPIFQGRVREAAVKYAMYLGPTQDASQKWALARQVLSNPEYWGRLFALAVSSEPETTSGDAADPAIDSADGDTALSYAIEMRVWPAYQSGMPTMITPMP